MPLNEVYSEDDELRVVRLTVANANVYVVEQSGKRLMIDAGNPGDQEEIERRMREQGIDPASVDFLLLTHGHLDHAGTAAYFQAEYGVEVIGGSGDAAMVRGEARGEVCPTGPLARAIRFTQRGKAIPPFELDREIAERPAPGFDLANLGMRGRVLPWPGHTDGSVVAIVGRQAFVGDLIRGAILDPTAPKTHFFMCDLEENRRRIRELLESESVDVWHTGHFGPLAVGDVRAFLDE